MDLFALATLARKLADWRAAALRLLTNEPPSDIIQAQRMGFLRHVIENPPPKITFIPEGWRVREAEMPPYEQGESYYEREKEMYRGRQPDNLMEEGFFQEGNPPRPSRNPDPPLSPTQVVMLNLTELFGGGHG